MTQTTPHDQLELDIVNIIIAAKGDALDIAQAILAAVAEVMPKEYPDPDKKYLKSGDWAALTAQRGFNEALYQVTNLLKGGQDGASE